MKTISIRAIDAKGTDHYLFEIDGKVVGELRFQSGLTTIAVLAALVNYLGKATA